MAEATIKEKVTRGMAWKGGATVLTRAFQAIVTIVLARLLDPGDFGVVGMTTLFTGFVAMFTELGLVSAIVQAKEVSDEQLNTIFWFGAGAGLLSWGLSAALAPTIARFFHMPVLSAIVPVSAVGMAVGSLGLVHRALLSRRLDFRSIAAADILAAFGFGAAAITGAVLGWGPWALVAGGLAMIAVRTAVVCWKAAWMPGLRGTWDGFGHLFGFGIKTLGVSMLGYMRGNVDYLVIGRLMGAVPLGYYTLAFKIADFPRARITPIFTEVAFPAFSSVRDAAETIRRGYLRGVRLVSLVVFPLLTGAALLAHELIVVVYGAKWLPSVFPAQVLLLMGMLLTVGEVSTTILLSKGRPGLQLIMSSGYTAAVAGFVLLGSRQGINGVAVGVCVATVAYFAVLVVNANRAIGVPVLRYARALQPTLTGCAAIAAAVLAARQLLVTSAGANDLEVLVGCTLAGAAAYFAGIGSSGRAELLDVLQTLLKPVLARRRERRAERALASLDVADTERG